MSRRTIPLLLVPLVMSCTTPHQQAALASGENDSTLAQDSNMRSAAMDLNENFHLVRDHPSVLVFENGDTLNTGISELRPLDRITDRLGRAWILFSGRNDGNAQSATSLFVFSPTDSTSHEAFNKPWHMPGQLVDPVGNKCYYEAEVFAGEVLRDTVGVIWYERSLMPDGQWKLNTTLLDLNGLRPDTLVFFGHGRKSSTLDLTFHGKSRMLDSLVQRLN